MTLNTTALRRNTDRISRAQLLFAASAFVCATTACSSSGDTTGAGGASSATASASSATSGSSTSSASSSASQAASNSSAASSASSSSSSGGSSGYNPIWIPETLTGTTFNLTLAKGEKQIRDGEKTATYGYNGAFWGPTLVMNKGDMVQMNVTNNLSEDTTTHWHGFHIPAVMDGGPHQTIPAGTTWSPSFEVKNKAAMYWYHPHLHLKTEEQLTYGAGGLILIKDPEEAALALPRTYGVDDIPVVLTSRRFTADNQFQMTKTSYGDYMLTNGVLNGKVDLPAQVVRLRILNVETERSYNLGFSDNRSFYVIGNDGGLGNAPIAVTRAQLYVGERLEILVDLTKDAAGMSLDLKAFNSNQPFGFPGGEPGQMGEFGSLLNNKDFPVLHVDVVAPTANAVTTIPAALANNTYWTAADATNSRTVKITDMGPGTPFTFDNKGFDANVVNQNVTLNTVEKWTISNGPTFNHSFHIHDVQFKIVARSSGKIADDEQGWKDTVRVPRNESVTFVAKFDDFSSAVNPFMYHCHMSNHEDGGLMGEI